MKKDDYKYLLGVNHSGYATRRNISGCQKQDVQVKQLVDVFRIYTHLLFKLFKISKQKYLNLFYDAKLNRTDVNHFFNGISLSDTPWITTFETSLPRLGHSPQFLYKLAASRLAHDSCKKIIALSKAAFEIQKSYLQHNYPELLPHILEKMLVLHPPQEPMNVKNKKYLDNGVAVFTVVGSDFFRKGGMEILKVFRKIEASEVGGWRLNIVSSMKYGDYASCATLQDYNTAMAYIQRSEQIYHYHSLPNEEVMEMFMATDVALLPTYADTYGYSVLEAQAAGCPVITTDIRALPEINNNECGWLIEAPKDDLGDANLKNNNDRRIFSEIVEQELFNIITHEILPDPEICAKKGKKAYQRIKSQHDPNAVAKTLRSIYKNSIVSAL